MHVHLDGDVFDPADEPHAPYLVAGGPSALDLRRLLAVLGRDREIVGVGVCGYAAADGTVSPAYAVALEAILAR